MKRQQEEFTALYCRLSQDDGREGESMKSKPRQPKSAKPTQKRPMFQLIAVTKKYTRIDELTPKILNSFVDKIVVHEREKKDGKRTQKIDIYYSYVGIVDIPTDEEMWKMEQEYMQRTTRQTA